jgi:CubicO group peptidase (beta-lactamase class C family)
LPASDELAAELCAILAKAQAESRLPSIAGAVVRGREILWSHAVGLADAEADEAATPEHQYRIGSITKTFTVAVMQLRDAGKLDLEDRLDSHLGVPARGDLTLRRMLSHGSGLQREIPGNVWETLQFPKSTEELLATLTESEMVLAPGERWHYSNLAFILLGEVIAKVSGTAYEDYVETRILEPLGLTRTSFAPEPPIAVAYSVEPYTDVVQREPMLVERTGGIAAAGQLWSTVGDLCRWAAFLASPDPAVLAAESLELMTSVQSMADPYRWSLAWGVGLMLVRSGDRIYCGHDGGMPGYLANVLIDRDSGLGGAVLVNGANVRPTEVTLSLVDKLRERQPEESEAWRPGAPPPDDLASALGRWWSEGAEFVFRWHGGRLESRWTGAPDWMPWTRFERIEGDRFRTGFGRERGEPLELVRGQDGKVTRMYWATYPFDREHKITGG